MTKRILFVVGYFSVSKKTAEVLTINVVTVDSWYFNKVIINFTNFSYEGNLNTYPNKLTY